jgi:hypothetical protein
MRTNAVDYRPMSPGLGVLDGDNLQRWSDPRPFRLRRKMVTCAVIFEVVAHHSKNSLEPVDYGAPSRPVQLERNAEDMQRQLRSATRSLPE